MDTYPNQALCITIEDIQARFDDSSPENVARLIAAANATNTDPNLHTWVAKEYQRVVGLCTAAREPEIGRLLALYVHPSAQSRGIGRTLLTTAFEWIGTSMDVYLDVAEYNSRAIAFYLGLGFEPSGNSVKEPVRPFVSGAVIPEIELVRRTRL